MYALLISNIWYDIFMTLNEGILRSSGVKVYCANRKPIVPIDGVGTINSKDSRVVVQITETRDSYH